MAIYVSWLVFDFKYADRNNWSYNWRFSHKKQVEAKNLFTGWTHDFNILGGAQLFGIKFSLPIPVIEWLSPEHELLWLQW